MKLTDTQLVILSAASQREDRAVEYSFGVKVGINGPAESAPENT